jgi:ADP-ribosyl-[dinitrogen reductase] hydrolase
VKPPLPNSYWVEPGLVLAGEHPDGGSERLTRERLAALHAAGVRVFIDLTQPGEMPSYQELLPDGVLYQNLPIPDHSVPDAATRMQEIQHVLAQTVANNVPAYVHCRAGIGRTGIAMGCYLREQGAGPRTALMRLNKLWLQNARAAHWPSVPETEEQESYILSWRPAGAKKIRTAPTLAMSAAASEATRAAAAPTLLQRYRGCLLGLAVGDAVGSALESPDGQLGWSDDTGMALCTAESLLTSGGFDGRDQVERYRAWARDPAAEGAAAAAALRPAVQAVLARALWNRSAVLGSHDPAQADAALLARCAPAVLFAGGSLDAAVALAADTTRVIQQSQPAVDACRLYAAMLAIALAGGSRQDVLRAAGAVGGSALRPELQQLAAGWLAKAGGTRRPVAARGLPGALDRVARTFAAGKDFNDGLAAVLDKADAERDALGAAWGALAGAFMGEAAIGALQQRIAGLTRVAQLAERLYEQRNVAHAPVA